MLFSTFVYIYCMEIDRIQIKWWNYVNDWDVTVKLVCLVLFQIPSNWLLCDNIKWVCNLQLLIRQCKSAVLCFQHTSELILFCKVGSKRKFIHKYIEFGFDSKKPKFLKLKKLLHWRICVYGKHTAGTQIDCYSSEMKIDCNRVNEFWNSLLQAYTFFLKKKKN